jgi:WD40 repeat protein
MNDGRCQHLPISWTIVPLVSVAFVVSTTPSAAGDDGLIATLTIPQHDDLPKYPYREVIWLGVSPDSKWIGARYRLRADRDCVCVWSRDDWKANTFEIDCFSSFRQGFQDCAFNAASDTLMFADRKTLSAYSLGSHRITKLCDLPASKGSGPILRSVAALGEQKKVVVTSVENSIGLHQTVIDSTTEPKIISEFRGKYSSIDHFSLSRDGSIRSIGYIDVKGDDLGYAFEVWDTVGPKRLFSERKDSGPVSSSAVSADSSLLASGAEDGRLVMWNVRKGTATQLLMQNFTISSVDFHPRSKLLVYTTLGGKGTENMGLVNLDTGKLLKAWNVDSRGADFARFSPDGKVIVSLGNEGIVKIWDVSSLPSK